MKTFNRSLLAIALLGGIIPARAMESQDPDKQENAASNGSKLTFENPNRENGLGALQSLPDDKIFEIMLFCIDWDKTTLKEAFSTIQSLCESSKFLYNFAHEMLFNARLVRELCEQIKIMCEMTNYKQEALKEARPEARDFDANLNAIHIAVAKRDLSFLKKILPKLKEYNLFHLMDKVTVRTNVDNVKLSHTLGDFLPGTFSWSGIFHKGSIPILTSELNEQHYVVAKLLLEYGAKCEKNSIVSAYRRENVKLIAFLGKYLRCEQIRDFFTDEEMQQLYIFSSIKSTFKEMHKCNTCTFE